MKNLEAESVSGIGAGLHCPMLPGQGWGVNKKGPEACSMGV